MGAPHLGTSFIFSQYYIILSTELNYIYLITYARTLSPPFSSFHLPLAILIASLAILVWNARASELEAFLPSPHGLYL